MKFETHYKIVRFIVITAIIFTQSKWDGEDMTGRVL